jgi:ribosomal protein L34
VDPGVTARERTSGVRARYDPGVEARERTSGVRARYDPGVEARERMGVRFAALKHLDKNDLRFWGFMPFTFARVVLLSIHAYLASFLRYPFCDMNVTQYG